MALQVNVPVEAKESGATLVAVAAHADGHSFVNDEHTAILVNNAAGTTQTVEIVTTKLVGGLTVANRAVVLLTTVRKLIGPFSVDLYGTTVTFTFSSTASVSFDLIKV